MSIEQNKLKNIIEAAMFAVAHPMSVDQLLKLFNDDDRPSANTVKAVITQLQNDCEGRGIELKEIASGYRYQARQGYSEWLSRLWEERPAKYSRAALETLALIAYRQPVTRAEIEDVRGVGVSSSIIKTMIEREWIRVVGHRDVPGRPALYATTKQFLDYFNMKSLEELPTLAEIKDLEDINPELNLPNPDDERDVSTDSSVELSDKMFDEASKEQQDDDYDQQNLLVSGGDDLPAEDETSSEVEAESSDKGLKVDESTDQSDEKIASDEPGMDEQETEELEADELDMDESGEVNAFASDSAFEFESDQDDSLDPHSDSNKDSFYAQPETDFEPQDKD